MVSAHKRLLELTARHSFVTAADVARAGIHSQELTRLVAQGILERIARGQYHLANTAGSEHHGLVLASKAVPQGVICLLSALEFHGIGTQLPPDIWIAVDRRARAPATSHLPLQLVRYGGAAFTEGIETHVIEGQRVRIYSTAKTLADLFKYRNKVGLDVALEALREAWRDKKFSIEALDRAARVCRVGRIMRPYLEAVLS